MHIPGWTKKGEQYKLGTISRESKSGSISYWTVEDNLGFKDY